MDILAEGMAMAFCARCGASLSGNPPFCLSCATPVMSAVTSALPRAAVAVREPESADTGSNVAAALAYLGGFISGIIVLMIERYKQTPFVRFRGSKHIQPKTSVKRWLPVIGRDPVAFG
jgi:hypothetical protein